MRPYSNDLRQRVVAAVERGEHSQRQLATLFGVSVSWITKLLHRYRTDHTLAPKPQGGDRKSSRDPAVEDRLRQAVRDHADATLDELRQHAHYPGSLWAVGRALRRLRITRKKKTLRAQEQDRPDVQQRRQDFAQQVLAIDPTRLVFVDESGADTTLTRRYGRAPRGERVVGNVPGAWDRLTVASAVRLSGVVASLVYPGGTDTEAFATFVEQVLVPQLRPGDVLVWDNLSSHDQPDLVARLATRGISVLPLPPYSPDLSPIEKMWSKVKAWLRKLGARTVETLYTGFGIALAAVCPKDVRGWFASCGLSYV